VQDAVGANDETAKVHRRTKKRFHNCECTLYRLLGVRTMDL
jgi:hypothetical protein